MTDQCCAVPLIELLDRIPANAVLRWTDLDGLKASHSMPIGKYAHEAAAAIRAQQKTITELSWDGRYNTLEAERDALKAELADVKSGRAYVIQERERNLLELISLRAENAKLAALVNSAPLLPFKIAPHGPPVRKPKGPRK